MPKKKAEKSVLNEVKETVKELAEDIAEKAKDTVETIAGTLEGTMEEVTEKVEDVISGAKKIAKPSKEVKKKVAHVKKTITKKVVKKEKPKKITKKVPKKEKPKEKPKKIIKKEKPKEKAKPKSAKAKLLEKAKELEKAVKEVREIDLKKKLKPEEEKETLVPIEDYLKASLHLGTKVITPDMRSYVYRRRADGLAVFNTDLLDDKIREGAEYLAEFAPEDIILVCKRESGWHAANKFAEVTGIKVFTKKYPTGILTNSQLDDFIETKLVFICDPWLDKNVFRDALKIRVPILAICDTNNYTAGITKIIPGNNKSFKSLGMIFYLLAKLYVKKRKLDAEVPPIQEFVEGWDELIPPK